MKKGNIMTKERIAKSTTIKAKKQIYVGFMALKFKFVIIEDLGFSYFSCNEYFAIYANL
jgi:hypothetical protein